MENMSVNKYLVPLLPRWANARRGRISGHRDGVLIDGVGASVIAIVLGIGRVRLALSLSLLPMKTLITEVYEISLL